MTLDMTEGTAHTCRHGDGPRPRPLSPL